MGEHPTPHFLRQSLGSGVPRRLDKGFQFGSEAREQQTSEKILNGGEV